MIDVIYRNLNNRDFPSAIPLLDEAADYFPNLSADSLRDAARRNIARTSAIAAFDGDTVAGIILYSTILSKISFLYVSPQYRGRGIARELVSLALEALPDHEVVVDTFAADDPRGNAARAMYLGMGFIEVGELDGYDVGMVRLALRR